MAGRVLCVFCRANEADPRHHPFCSERCRLLDLGSWIDGRYRVPGEPVSPDPESPDAPDEG